MNRESRQISWRTHRCASMINYVSCPSFPPGAVWMDTMIRTFLRRPTSGGFLLIGLLLLTASGRAAEPARPSAEAVRFFESGVQPVLVDNCFKCHADKKQRGGLRLDSRAALVEGGDQGAALVP